jgi:hypothetical protein
LRDEQDGTAAGRDEPEWGCQSQDLPDGR